MSRTPIADAVTSVEESTEAAFATVALSYASSDGGAEPVSNEAQAFANDAGTGELFAIQSSQLALGRSSNGALKVLARRISDAHAMAMDELKAAAAAATNVTAPTELDQAGADSVARLRAADDAAFNALYVELEASSHVEAVAQFSGYAATASPGPLKDFAARTVPMLEQHLAELRSFTV